MTFEEIDERYRSAVLEAGPGDEQWDDPETGEDGGGEDDELGYRDADEDATYDETGGGQGEGDDR